MTSAHWLSKVDLTWTVRCLLRLSLSLYSVPTPLSGLVGGIGDSIQGVLSRSTVSSGVGGYRIICTLATKKEIAAD